MRSWKTENGYEKVRVRVRRHQLEDDSRDID